MQSTQDTPGHQDHLSSPRLNELDLLQPIGSSHPKPESHRASLSSRCKTCGAWMAVVDLDGVLLSRLLRQCHNAPQQSHPASHTREATPLCHTLYLQYTLPEPLPMPYDIQYIITSRELELMTDLFMQATETTYAATATGKAEVSHGSIILFLLLYLTLSHLRLLLFSRHSIRLLEFDGARDIFIWLREPTTCMSCKQSSSNQQSPFTSRLCRFLGFLVDINLL